MALTGIRNFPETRSPDARGKENNLKRHLIRTATAAVAAALCISLALTSCSSGETKESKQTDASSNGLHFSACMVGQPESLDPFQANNATGQTILTNIYENLMKIVPDSTGKTTITYGAAKSYEEKSNYDGTVTYTFRLRDSKWADGVAVTADDFVYAWKRLIDPALGSPYAALFSNVVGYQSARSSKNLSKLKIQAKNDTTLVVTLTGECPWFLRDTCTAAAAVPLRRDVVKRLKNDAKKAEKEKQKVDGGWCFAPDRLITNGPYRIASYTEGESIVLKTNPGYTGNFNGPESIRITFADTAEKAWSLYHAQKVDFVSELSESQMKTLSKQKGWEAQTELTTGVLLFNTQKDPFSDPLICQAFAKAVDRTALSQELSIADSAATGLVPDGVPGTGKKSFRSVGGDLLDCNPDNYEAECREAKALLEKAGYDADKSPAIELLCTQSTKSAAEKLAKMLTESLKVSLKVNCVSEKEAASALAKGNYTAAVTEVTALANDAESFLSLWTSKNSKNVVGYQNSAYDTLLSVIGSASDKRARMGCLHDAESLLLDDCPLTPLYFTGTAWKLREKFTGLSRDSRGWFAFDHMAKMTSNG